MSAHRLVWRRVAITIGGLAALAALAVGAVSECAGVSFR